VVCVFSKKPVFFPTLNSGMEMFSAEGDLRVNNKEVTGFSGMGNIFQYIFISLLRTFLRLSLVFLLVFLCQYLWYI
jgi:hypothetical protein